MKALTKLFQQLCSKIIILLTLLLVELIVLLWRLTSEKRSITTKQYLEFIEENNPTIRYAKRRSSWSELEHVVPDDTECRVCLSEFEEGEKVRRLKCKHTFHKDCLDKWLQECWATCPLCRKQVLPCDVVSKHRHFLSHEENVEHLPYLLFVWRGGNGSNFRRYVWIQAFKICS